MTPNLEIVVRRLNRETAPSVFLEIGAIHAAKISAGFLAQLGPSFLAGLYRFLADRHYLFGAFENEKLVGFISGTADSSTVNKRFLRSLGISDLLRLCSAVIKPSNLRRALSLWSYLTQKTPADLPPAELLSLAVLPAFSRHGTVFLLLHELEASFAARKITRYKIGVSETQVISLQFFRKLCGKAAGVTMLGGLKTEVFVMKIPRA